MSVAVVIPTISGRAEHLARCLDAYRRTAPNAQIIIERGHPSCGAAWIAGAAAAGEFDYLHFTADDLEPHDGWLQVAVETVDAGYIPAPLVNHPGGELESAGLLGFGCYRGPHADWQLIEGTTVPFLTRQMWEAIGMAPIHYCSDLLVSTIGRRHGWETAIRTEMRFTHHTAQAGRNYGRVPADTQEYIRQIGAVCAS
jgi:hypothetical protein